LNSHFCYSLLLLGKVNTYRISRFNSNYCIGLFSLYVARDGMTMSRPDGVLNKVERTATAISNMDGTRLLITTQLGLSISARCYLAFK